MNQSHLSKQAIPSGESVQCKEIRPSILDLIRVDFPSIQLDDFISLEELNKYRRLYLTKLVEQEKGDLARLDRGVMDAIVHNSILSDKIRNDKEAPLTFGDRMADRIATFGGSWTFILLFFSFLLIWMAINIWLLASKPFDPYPFILLNLILSCLAAIQAPIIMMSQNRQESKDRKRAENDYQINLKAELEIKLLSEKMDHLLIYQNKKLLEIQEVQIDYLEDLLKKVKNISTPDESNS